jgi:hypothetical protein
MAEDFIKLSFGRKGRVYDNVADGIDAFVEELKTTWEAQPQQIAPVLLDYLTQVAKVLVERNSGGSTTATALALRTGASVNSITRSVKVKGTTWATLSGAIGGLAQLAIHEYGGTIKAKGKMLTIPLPAALSGKGTAPPFARQWKNTFVARTRRGNLLIFQRRGATVVPLYVLKDQVKIPARLGMRRELNAQIPYFLQRAVDRIVTDVAKQLGG